jgi:hypothetical protein
MYTHALLLTHTHTIILLPLPLLLLPGPFWGAPDGMAGYHAEGGGCCHYTGANGASDAVQFWRAFQIDVKVV